MRSMTFVLLEREAYVEYAFQIWSLHLSRFKSYSKDWSRQQRDRRKTICPWSLDPGGIKIWHCVKGLVRRNKYVMQFKINIYPPQWILWPRLVLLEKVKLQSQGHKVKNCGSMWKVLSQLIHINNRKAAFVLVSKLLKLSYSNIVGQSARSTIEVFSQGIHMWNMKVPSLMVCKLFQRLISCSQIQRRCEHKAYDISSQDICSISLKREKRVAGLIPLSATIFLPTNLMLACWHTSLQLKNHIQNDSKRVC